MMRQVEQYCAKVMGMCIEKEPEVKTTSCFVGPFGGCTSERCHHSRLLCLLLCVGPTWDRRVGACSLNAGAEMSMRMGTATSARFVPTAWSPWCLSALSIPSSKSGLYGALLYGPTRQFLARADV